jgi:hypothetical protein
VKCGHKHRNFVSFTGAFRPNQDVTMPYYASINLGPNRKSQRYVIPGVALLRCVALPSLRL